MTSLARALLEQFGPNDLAELADRLRLYLPPTPEPNGDEWLDSKRAAAHLGISMATLRRLIAAKDIPVHQERAGGRIYFRRAELDQWRTQT